MKEIGHLAETGISEFTKGGYHVVRYYSKFINGHTFTTLKICAVCETLDLAFALIDYLNANDSESYIVVNRIGSSLYANNEKIGHTQTLLKNFGSIYDKFKYIQTMRRDARNRAERDE